MWAGPQVQWEVSGSGAERPLFTAGDRAMNVRVMMPVARFDWPDVYFLTNADLRVAQRPVLYPVMLLVFRRAYSVPVAEAPGEVASLLKPDALRQLQAR